MTESGEVTRLMCARLVNVVILLRCRRAATRVAQATPRAPPAALHAWTRRPGPPAGSADRGPRNGASRATSGVRQFSAPGTEEICQGARLRHLAPVLEGHEVGGRRPVRRQGAIAGHRQPPRWRAGPGGSTERDSPRDGAASPQPQETCAEARSSVFPPSLRARLQGPPTVPRERHRG